MVIIFMLSVKNDVKPFRWLTTVLGSAVAILGPSRNLTELLANLILSQTWMLSLSSADRTMSSSLSASQLHTVSMRDPLNRVLGKPFGLSQAVEKVPEQDLRFA